MIQYKKEHGYPVDMDLDIEKAEGGYKMTAIINGKEIYSAMVFTPEARRYFAKGFLLGYEFAKKEPVLFDPTCCLCGEALTSEELICKPCAGR